MLGFAADAASEAALQTQDMRTHQRHSCSPNGSLCVSAVMRPPASREFSMSDANPWCQLPCRTWPSCSKMRRRGSLHRSGSSATRRLRMGSLTSCCYWIMWPCHARYAHYMTCSHLRVQSCSIDHIRHLHGWMLSWIWSLHSSCAGAADARAWQHAVCGWAARNADQKRIAAAVVAVAAHRAHRPGAARHDLGALP